MGSKPTTDDIKRSRTMSRIKSKDTSIELALRKALWNAGIRYRKNYTQSSGFVGDGYSWIVLISTIPLSLLLINTRGF